MSIRGLRIGDGGGERGIRQEVDRRQWWSRRGRGGSRTKKRLLIPEWRSRVDYGVFKRLESTDEVQSTKETSSQRRPR